MTVYKSEMYLVKEGNYRLDDQVCPFSAILMFVSDAYPLFSSDYVRE